MARKECAVSVAAVRRSGLSAGGTRISAATSSTAGPTSGPGLPAVGLAAPAIGLGIAILGSLLSGGCTDRMPAEAPRPGPVMPDAEPERSGESPSQERELAAWPERAPEGRCLNRHRPRGVPGLSSR
ncbi:hypothetical protein [Streptomyces sp. NPDC048710]|uniref:hypothetical protein n=1 Tax=Streptomyces sp. NPDC048710 TaxID=3365586 RepID=UPI0037147E54